MGRVLSRAQQELSPWLTMVAKQIQFDDETAVHTYHCLSQADYVAVLAVTPESTIPIVRQYRPAVEDFTWELPAGLVDEGEHPEQTCRRELQEETGWSATEIVSLGVSFPDTGRLSNKMHAYFIRAAAYNPSFVPERGMMIRYVRPLELQAMVLNGEFRHQLHLGVLGMAAIKGLWSPLLTDACMHDVEL